MRTGCQAGERLQGGGAVRESADAGGADRIGGEEREELKDSRMEA